MIYQNVSELIGRTPIVKVNLPSTSDLELLVKLESFNPGGSVKDRIALGMIQDAEQKGRLFPGATLIEPSSGNTGIALAMLGATRGYKVILVMPETMSIERRHLMKAYGAEIVLTPGAEGMSGAVRKAQELCQEHPDWVMLQQFENPANPAFHYQTTGPEIYEALEGRLDYFVSGVGTGGTLTGAGKFLKERIPELKIIAVEPYDSSVLSGEPPGPHRIQGIGAGFIPQVLDTGLIDQIVRVRNEDAFEAARSLAKEQGILVGISSGAAVWAALQIAKQASPGQRILAIAPDTGERYLSMDLFTV
mgnify:CR=1 FL=1